MADRHRVASDAEVLSAPVAERVLRRASELDAVRSTGTVVAELRAAAAEAGISADAFDAALGELQKAEPAPSSVSAVGVRRWRRRFFGLAGLGAVVLIAATVVIPTRLALPANDTMIEHTIRLNCLSANRALELVRPLLTDPANRVVSPGDATGTITIRATPQQVEQVRAAIAQVDDAASCARR